MQQTAVTTPDVAAERDGQSFLRGTDGNVALIAPVENVSHK